MNPGGTPRRIDKATPSRQQFCRRAYPGSRLTRGPDAGGGTFASGSGFRTSQCSGYDIGIPPFFASATRHQRRFL